MSLDQDAVVWAFNADAGSGDALAQLIGVMTKQLTTLLPKAVEDPFEQVAAEFSDDPTARMLSNPRLRRMFPPTLPDQQEADQFWRDSLGAQARSRLSAAETVTRACAGAEGWVPVTLGQADDWLKTLSALRLFWHAELAGPERLAEALDDGSGLQDVIDWLGYLVEELVMTRDACLAEGRGLEL